MTIDYNFDRPQTQELMIVSGLTQFRQGFTLDQLWCAFYSRQTILGFYIKSIGIGMDARDDIEMLKDIVLIHAETYLEIRFDHRGNCSINGQSVNIP